MSVEYIAAIFPRLLLFSLCATVVLKADICKNTTQQEVTDRISSMTAPKAGADAGVFNILHDTTVLEQCVLACCNDKKCNAVLYTDSKCFTIQCSSDDGCSPGPINNNLANDTYLVNIRLVAETEAVNIPLLNSTPKSPVPPEELTDHPTCELNLIGECSTNEECVATGQNSLKKQGTCQCKDGLTRNADTKTCISTEDDVGNQLGAVTLNTESTSTAISTTPKPITQESLLIVSAGDDKVLPYPENSVTLSAFALPSAGADSTENSTDEIYTYEWTLVTHPESESESIGHMSGKDTKQLHLTDLVSGVYKLQVDVSGDKKAGTAYVNVTVLPEVKVNKAPIAVVKPTIQKIKEDAMGILDGSSSSDDDEIVKYFWEIVSGPLSESYLLNDNDDSMLRLKGLGPGSYTVRLTVTDKDGLTNSTLATVNVKKLTDYPPIARAGDDVMVYLPSQLVTLYGNGSTDDYGIASYEWRSKTDELTADMVGVHQPILRLANLQQGTYTFELEVTDTAGQSSSAEVHVFVKPQANHAPIAAVAQNVTRVAPGSVAQLNGSPSTDDQTIVSYQWSQVSGPNEAQLVNSDRQTASASELVKGEYKFKLKVMDAQQLSSETFVTIKVSDHANEAPHSNAGSNVKARLPIDMITLNGNGSNDDSDIMTYLWTKSDDSPAAGDIVDNSDKTSTLRIINLVPGRYTFTLSVTDQEGLSSTDEVILNVEPDPMEKNLVELALDTPIETFTEKHRKDLAVQLALMLPSYREVSKVTVDIRGVHRDYYSGKLAVVFAVYDYNTPSNYTVRNGTLIKTQLRQKLSRNSELIGFTFSNVDTVVCQNDCSGHGHCDQFSKECVCEPFWMTNYAKVAWANESNCEWSILYVVLTALAGILIVSFMAWFCLCCTRRCRKTKGRRKHTYQLLEDLEQMSKDGHSQKKKRNNIAPSNGSLFLSESDLSSDEEDTLFVSGKGSNNGGPTCNNTLMKRSYDLVKANNLKNKLNT